jgi:peroxin-10
MEIHHQQQLHAVPGNASVQQAGRWIAKLQLAHFCLTGMYPTWVHRLSGHAMVPSESPSRIHHPPTTARLVGLLLGAQVVATMIQASSSAASHWLVHRQLKRRQSQQQSASETESSPAIVFKSESDKPSNASHSNSLGSSICSICKMERTHPSAPSSCGHVFCWKCLVHWVSVIRPECPLCRAACRPQDIVALYNYEP